MKNKLIEILPGQVTDLPVHQLLPDPDQPRKAFDDTALAQLAASIAQRGVLVPLLVRPGLKGKYIIQDGERRYRAAQLAKIDDVPVLLINSDTSEESIRTDQLTVNNLRERLKPMEIARLLADLQRQHFAGVNELAAYLEQTGLPAMTPKQLAQTIALVDLPDWTQAMIDDGEVEAADAAPVMAAMRDPNVLQVAQKNIRQRIKWTGRATGEDILQEVQSAYRMHAVDLGYTEHWDDGTAHAVHFNPQTTCKGCEHLVKVGKKKYCLNRAEFERRNAEAKAAGLLPGGKKPTKPVSQEAAVEQEAEKKAEKRGQTLGEKVREYLHGYLILRLMQHMRTDINITDELLSWHAMGRPGEDRYSRHPALPHYSAEKESEVLKLEDLIASTNLDPAKKCAAIELAHGLKWRETQVLCHELWGSAIELVWEIDYAFVNLFRKAELLFLVEQHHLTLEEGRTWQKLKASELKAEILKRDYQVRRPAILQDLYETIADPYVPWGDRQYDEEDLTDEYVACDVEDEAAEADVSDDLILARIDGLPADENENTHD